MEATRHPLFHPAAFRHGVLSDPPDIPSAHTPPQSPPHIPNTSSLPTAAPVAPVAPAAPAAALWRAFPAVPYYAPARGLQLRVELRDGRDAAALQSLLHRAASRHGALHIFSSAPKRPVPPHVPSPAAPAPPAALFDPAEYVTALHDGFARLCALRERCRRRSPPRATHHALYVRISGDAQLKDVSALLAVERGRLCLCLCASSRVTQEHLSQQAHAAGAPVEWLLGAALVEEPAALCHRAALCPVAAAWDAVAGLSPSAGAAVQVAASFPLAGARRHSPALRLTEMGATDRGAVRALWTLVGPAPRAVLPQFVAAIVRALVERGGVEAFELRLLHDESDAAASGGGAIGTIGTAAAAQSAQWEQRGVAFVGAARDGAVVRRGPTSAASPLAFSRMSAKQWLSEEDCTRNGLLPPGGTGGTGGGEEVEPLECEFALDALRYERRKGVGGDGRDETERGGGAEGEEGEKVKEKEEEEEEGEDDGDLFDTQRWGECFQMRLHVECIIDGEDTE